MRWTWLISCSLDRVAALVTPPTRLDAVWFPASRVVGFCGLEVPPLRSRPCQCLVGVGAPPESHQPESTGIFPEPPDKDCPGRDGSDARSQTAGVPPQRPLQHPGHQPAARPPPGVPVDTGDDPRTAVEVGIVTPPEYRPAMLSEVR